MHGEAAGVFAHPVPAVEITGAVVDIDIPVQVHVSDAADLSVQDHLPQFFVGGRVPVVERADHFSFGIFFRFQDPHGVGGIGGHGFFADHIQTMSKPADHIVHMCAVDTGHDQHIRLLFCQHFYKFRIQISRHIHGSGHPFPANLKSARIDIQHTDQLRTVGERFQHGTYKHCHGSV